jgi:hypothetical protein
VGTDSDEGADDDGDEDDDAPTDKAAPEATLFRAKYDWDAAAEEVAARGLPGDVYRAATIRMGKLIR